MKPLTAILLFALVGTIFGVYLLRGFGPDQQGALFRPYKAQVAESYFRSPEAAVNTISALLQDEDWVTLAKYYDLSGSNFDVDQLSDGSFFLSSPSDSDNVPTNSAQRPFTPGLHFLQSKQTHIEDIFEVTVSDKNSEHVEATSERPLQTFFLHRYPEGYQLLLAFPSTEILNSNLDE